MTLRSPGREPSAGVLAMNVAAPRSTRSFIATKWTLVAALSTALLSGCSSLEYYAQAARGHLALMSAARPVADWIADPATPEPLRERLRASQEIRRFATRELALPDNASYTRYAQLGRPAVVWNVIAAPELSLELKTWCFPVLGCVGYRGYFDREQAQAQADALRAEGWETAVYGVPAYSTLGWSNAFGGDPLLDTFLSRGSQDDLAGLVFHELAHQQVYADGDTRFNESYATAVERLGLQRWQAAHGRGEPAQQSAASSLRRDLRALTARTRDELRAAYAAGGSQADRRAAKAQILQSLRERYATLKESRQREPALATHDWSGTDRWIAQLNNASLAIQGVYDDAAPQFESLFRASGSRFDALHTAARCLKDRPAPARWQELRSAAGPCWPGAPTGKP